MTKVQGWVVIALLLFFGVNVVAIDIAVAKAIHAYSQATDPDAPPPVVPCALDPNCSGLWQVRGSIR